ncbi:MAG: glutamate synthase-related protein, partial [Candidatus Sumerlaeota bacterium]
YIFGTAALIATGCVMARQCHLNTCPVGVATQKRELRDKYSGTADHLVQYFQFLAQDLRELMAKLGYDNLNELIGRVDLLKQVHRPDCARSTTLDLTPMLAVVDPDRKRAQRRIRPRNNNSQMNTNVDDALIQDAQEIIRQRKGHVTLKAELTNTDRTVGGKLAGEIAFLHGDAGLLDAEIEVNFTGTAGQSFGAFCIHGMRLRLVGEANDYVGKSMAGGEIVVTPPADAAFKPEENSVVGNTCLYGATGGSLFVCGRAGERFGVRLSGAKAVVEGVGEHACEYMTGGLVVILGDTGRNFGAGMTGGQAFVYDKNKTFERRYNDELIEIVRVIADADVHTLKVMITAHLEKTDSDVARRVLDNWNEEVKHFYLAQPIPPQLAEAASASPETAEQKKS